MPSKQYGVILADPPWHFEHQSWRETMPPDQVRYEFGPGIHYPTMSLEDICGLDVASLAADNCALFLWFSWPHFLKPVSVIEAWGFEYKTIAWVWAKLNKSGLGFKYGLGYYTHSNTEPCLLATKGRMIPIAKDVLSLIVTPIREHSRKPDEQYAKIERMYPDVPKLELFARRPRDGWDVWGNEVESTVEL